MKLSQIQNLSQISSNRASQRVSPNPSPNPSQKVSFKAQTKNGNDYKKSHAGLVGALASSTILSAYDVFKGRIAGEPVTKPLKIAGAVIGISTVLGAGLDYIFNRKRAKNADKNPLSLEQKFERDFNSKKFGIYYDSILDAVILENKKQSDRYKLEHTSRSKKDNQYTLKDDGSVTVTNGRDCAKYNDAEVIKKDDGSIIFKAGEDKPFIENNEVVKKVVNEAKIAKLNAAHLDKNYNYSYNKEKDIVTLRRAPQRTGYGFHSYESFNFRPDGSITIVTNDGLVERPIHNLNGTMVFDNFADE